MKLTKIISAAAAGNEHFCKLIFGRKCFVFSAEIGVGFKLSV